jgi:cytochrome c553
VRHLTILLMLVGVGRLSAQDLPAGSGRDIVVARCATCHETDLITQQRLSRAAWEREIDKMVRWGAVVESQQREPLLDYLAAHFARTAPVAPPSIRVDAYAACLACHGEDLIQAQRLSRAGWTREIEKMIRWGAAVSDSEKNSLIEYLSARFPVHARGSRGNR